MSLPLPKPGSGLMTIAFDLDGTLSEPTWPQPFIGRPIQGGVEAAFAYADKGYEIIIFTSRPYSHRKAIESWLRGVASPFDPLRMLDSIVYDIVTDKPRACLYVDDRAATFPQAFESVCNGDDKTCEMHPQKPRMMRSPTGALHEERLKPLTCADRGCVPA